MTRKKAIRMNTTRMSSMKPKKPITLSGSKSKGHKMQKIMMKSSLRNLTLPINISRNSLRKTQALTLQKTQGSSSSRRNKGRLSSKVRLYCRSLSSKLIVSSLLQNCLNRIVIYWRQRGHIILRWSWLQRLQRHSPQQECPQVEDTGWFLGYQRQIAQLLSFTISLRPLYYSFSSIRTQSASCLWKKPRIQAQQQHSKQPMARIGIAKASITSPPMAYIMKELTKLYELIANTSRQLKQQEMRKVPTAGFIFQEVIKHEKYKVIKAVSCEDQSLMLLVKVMVFKKDEPLMWLENQLLERLFVIGNVNGRGLLSNMLCSHILEATFTEGEEYKTVYLSKPHLLGYSLGHLLTLEHKMKQLLPEDRDNFIFHFKKLMLRLMGIMISGAGHRSLLVTLQNLLFEQVGGEELRPTLNYFSFVGYPLLRLGQPISMEQYLEIAIFLDRQAIQTGSTDRLQFKIRTFVCLALTLLLQRNPAQFVFRNENKQDRMIDKENALKLHNQVVSPGLKTLVESKEVSRMFSDFRLKDLHDIIKAVLGGKDSEKVNWQSVQMIVNSQFNSSKGIVCMLSDKSSATSVTENKFSEIIKKLWEFEKNNKEVEKKLTRLGLGLNPKATSSRENIFLAALMSHHVYNFLEHNSWPDLVDKQKFGHSTRQMMQRLLKKAEKSSLPEPMLKELFESVKHLNMADLKQPNREEVHTLPTDRARMLYDFKF